jgi:hypothetical protein
VALPFPASTRYNKGTPADNGKHKETPTAESTNRQTYYPTPERNPLMLHKNDFALEQLEERLEMLCIYVPYVATCYKKVWFVTIPYPCVKYYRLCF